MKCAHCAEEIQDQATKCRHCGEVPVSRAWQETYRTYAALSPKKQAKMFAGLDPEQQREFQRVAPILEAAGVRPAAPQQKMKVCPKCGETVPRRAYVCPRCTKRIAMGPGQKVIGCGCVGMLLFFVVILFGTPQGGGGEAATGEAPGHSEVMARVGSAGGHGFYVVPEELAFDTEKLHDEMRGVCGTRDFCRVLVWSDRTKAATSFPMSDDEVYHQVAHYSRNRNTGHDCFYLLAGGNPVEASRKGSC